MNLDRIEGFARIVCEALDARLVSVTSLASLDIEQLVRIEVACPPSASPIDFVMEFVSEHEVETLSDADLACVLVRNFYLRCRLAAHTAVARELGIPPEDLSDCL